MRSQVNGKLCVFGFEIGRNHLREVDFRHIVIKCYVSRKWIVEINAQLKNYLHIWVDVLYLPTIPLIQLNQSINIESHFGTPYGSLLWNIDLKPEIRRIDWVAWQISQWYSWFHYCRNFKWNYGIFYVFLRFKYISKPCADEALSHGYW